MATQVAIHAKPDVGAIIIFYVYLYLFELCSFFFRKFGWQ